VGFFSEALDSLLRLGAAALPVGADEVDTPKIVSDGLAVEDGIGGGDVLLL
jgi:hypothetical protein